VHNTVARILCVGHKGAAADWDLNAVLWAAAGVSNAPQQRAFDQDQERWRNSLNARCNLPADTMTFSERQYDCVLRVFHQRADSLRASLPPDAAAETRLTPDQRSTIQQRLIAKGFLQPPANGEFGPATRAAIRKWQQSQGNNPTGFLSADQDSHLATASASTTSSTPAATSSPTPVLPNPQPPALQPVANKALIEAEGRALTRQISKYWHFPLNSEVTEPFSVTIKILLSRDGRLSAPPEVISNGTSPLYPAAVSAATEAINRAQPFVGLPQDHYDTWKLMELVFQIKPLAPAGSSAAEAASSENQPFILRDVWHAKTPKVFGTIASADEICKLLKHPFFSHDPFWYKSTDWDPSNLGSQWFIDRDKGLPLHFMAMDVSTQTRRLTDANLRACLRTLAAEQSATLPIIAQLLNLPDAQGKGQSCYLGNETVTTKYMTPEGQIRERQSARPLPPCAQWPTFQTAQLPRPLELLLLLTLNEGHPALISLLDAANKQAPDPK
jgi:peptidoglycan hydrolase-like protein with peptidoglycan-binding domain